MKKGRVGAFLHALLMVLITQLLVTYCTILLEPVSQTRLTSMMSSLHHSFVTINSSGVSLVFTEQTIWSSKQTLTGEGCGQWVWLAN